MRARRLTVSIAAAVAACDEVLAMYELLLFLTMAPPCPEPPRPVLPGDLHRVVTCQYEGHPWSIHFSPEGRYWCGSDSGLWAGPWAVDKDTGVVTISEVYYYFDKAGVAQPSGPVSVVTLRIRWDRGRLVGTSSGGSWGADLTLEAK